MKKKGTKNSESILSTTITSNNMDTQCEVVIAPDRDKNITESKTIGDHRTTQNTTKKYGQTRTSITIQCDEEKNRK